MDPVKQTATQRQIQAISLTLSLALVVVVYYEKGYEAGLKDGKKVSSG